MVNTDELRRDPDVWFPDGSVVLLADNTLFKVYAGILRKHSQVFDDLFTIPQPPHSETYDGCPLIPLYGDTALDVHDFLLVIHDMEYVPDSCPPDTCVYDVAPGIFVASHTTSRSRSRCSG